MHKIKCHLKQALLLSALSFGVLLLSGCAGSGSAKPTLSDLGTRYWQGTYYLSVEGETFSIQCDVDPVFETLDDIKVRYKGQSIANMFDRSEDQDKILALKQQCLDRSVSGR